MASTQPFRFGVVATSALTREGWIELARKAETLGYSTLLVGEHIVSGGLAPMVALATAADVTTSLRVGTHVLNNDMHHPVSLAHEAATLDLLSSGRLDLGLGAGWMGQDYGLMGIPFDPAQTRISRLEESVRLLKQLFVDDPVDFDGKYYSIHGAGIKPKPLQWPHPPIFMGGGGKRMLSLAAHEANIVSLDPKGTAKGTKNMATITAEATEQKVSWIREAAGEKLNDLVLHNLVYKVVVTNDKLGGIRKIVDWGRGLSAHIMSNPLLDTNQILNSPHLLVGTVEEIADSLETRRDRYGISYITVSTESVDALAPIVAKLAGN